MRWEVWILVRLKRCTSGSSEAIHPFQDGNGRVGRLIMFKECLANNIVPFIITDELKLFYYRGLHEWGHINGYLTDTCLTAQDMYKEMLAKFLK